MHSTNDKIIIGWKILLWVLHAFYTMNLMVKDEADWILEFIMVIFSRPKMTGPRIVTDLKHNEC